MSAAIVTTSNNASSEAWELAAGASPSTASSIGFIQDRNGRITDIKGEANFTSARNINALFARYDESRTASQLGLTEVRLNNPTLIKGRHFEALPDELKALLKSGTVLVTSHQNQTQTLGNTQDIANDLRSANFDFLKLQLGKNIKNLHPRKTAYSILHYSFGEDNSQGRSGVLLDAATRKPIIVTVDQKEYVVEVKGCGLGTGGFGKLGTRSDEPSIPGAVMPKYARKEIENLNRELQPEGCKSACAVIGKIDGNEIGYILRLSPSTVRASYSDNAAFPATSEVSTEIAKAYAQLFIQQSSCSSPYLLLGPHHENILVSSNNNFSWTDYSDHVPLGANDPKFNTPKGLKDLVYRLFQGFTEVPGSSLSELVNFINIQASKFGLSFQLNSKNDINQHVEVIWKEYLANRVWESRQTEQFKLFNNELCNKEQVFDKTAWSKLQENYASLAKKLTHQEDTVKEAIPILEKLGAASDDNRIHDIYSLIDSLHKIDMRISSQFIGVIDPLRNLGYFDIRDVLTQERQFLEELRDINKKDTRFVTALTELETIERAVYTIFNSGFESVDKLKDQGASILDRHQPSYYSVQ